MAGLDPAIKVILKDQCFLLLDGPIKSGHDKSEFVGCPDFCPFYTRPQQMTNLPVF
jgi:hypothetical protein